MTFLSTPSSAPRSLWTPRNSTLISDPHSNPTPLHPSNSTPHLHVGPLILKDFSLSMRRSTSLTTLTSDYASSSINMTIHSLGKVLDMKLHFTSGYHPEGDGQMAVLTRLWNSTSKSTAITSRTTGPTYYHWRSLLTITLQMLQWA